jgi:hypothetical protein
LSFGEELEKFWKFAFWSLEFQKLSDMVPGNFKSGKIASMTYGNSKLGKVGPCENLEQSAKLPLNFQLVTQMVLAIITYTKWTLE